MKKSKLPWKLGSVETLASYAVAGAVFIGVAVVLGSEIAHHLTQFENWVAGLGPWAPLAFVVAYALLNSTFCPDTLLGIVAGATFGFTKGLLLASCGSLIAVGLQYGLARHTLKPTIDRIVAARPNLATIQAAVLRQQLKLQLLIRLTPLNRAMTSYILGAAGVSCSRFLLACVAIVPNLCLEVYFGYAGKHLAKIAGQPDRSVVFHDLALVTGLLVAIGVMVTVSNMARKAIEEASAIRL